MKDLPKFDEFGRKNFLIVGEDLFFLTSPDHLISAGKKPLNFGEDLFFGDHLILTKNRLNAIQD